ncbi:methyltransferase [Vibrio paucivorans]
MSSQYLTLFNTLDTFLNQTQEFWRFEPFHLSYADCELTANNSLGRWLFSLSNQEICELKESPELVTQSISQYIPSLAETIVDTQVLSLNSSELELPRGVSEGVPGRKLDQIVAMGSAVLERHVGEEWLEWCSGKGFLGRILAGQSNQKVTSFEYQQALCDSGQSEANRLELPMEFVQGDAFCSDSAAVFNDKQHAVALHACGDLHVTLLQRAVAASLPAVTFSPCCYHLIKHDSYQALSLPAKGSLLRLNKTELRIPLQETVTGGERVKRHRQMEMTYRLGLDYLLRIELGKNEYVPIPSIKKSLLSDGFEAFALWAFEQKGFNYSDTFPLDKYLKLGEERFWRMERLSLIQQPFRRLIELWLALDKILYLEEHGYRASIHEFCSRSATPRNLLIHAER